MTKATRILNKYHIKNMLLSGKTQFENFYKEELIQFCKVATAEIEQASKEKQELIDYLKEQKKEYIELYNKSCDIIDFDRYESLNILCEEILSKIEKSDK